MRSLHFCRLQTTVTRRVRGCAGTRSRPVLALALILPIFCASLLALHPVVLAQAHGDDAVRAQARSLGVAGIEAFRAGDYARADAKLEQAFGMFATPTLGLWSARARARRGLWVRAAERYREALAVTAQVGDLAVQEQARREASAELEALLPRIPTVTLQVEGSDPAAVQISIDGVPLASGWHGKPLPLDPGAHRVSAVSADQRRDIPLQLRERAAVAVPIRFEPARAESPAAPLEPAGSTSQQLQLSAAGTEQDDPLRPVAIALVVAGGASVVTSGVIALVANAELDDCPDRRCMTQSQKDSYDALVTASTATFWPGAALAAAGVVTWILSGADEGEHAQRIALRASSAGVELEARF